jgi:hypothetical protein
LEVGVAIIHLGESKRLRRQGERLGRPGLSQRAHKLIAEYVSNHPDGHYREAIMLAGRLHAIFLAAKCDQYWHEVSMRGYSKELLEIGKFEPEPVEYK